MSYPLAVEWRVSETFRFIEVAVEAKETTQVMTEARIEESVPKKSRKNEARAPLMLERLCESHGMKVRVRQMGPGVYEVEMRRTVPRIPVGGYRPQIECRLFTGLSATEITPADVMASLFERLEESQMPFEAWCKKRKVSEDSVDAYTDWKVLKRVPRKIEILCGDRIHEFHVAARAYRRCAPRRRSA